MRLRATRGLGAVLADDFTLPNVDGTSVRLSDLLGRSLLTGAVVDVAEVANDRRMDNPRFHAENFERNRDMATFVEAMAKRKRCTPAQVALAWLLAQRDDIIAIPGTKHIERIDDNLGALDVQLSTNERQALADAFPPGAAAGTHYPAGGMKGVYI